MVSRRPAVVRDSCGLLQLVTSLNLGENGLLIVENGQFYDLISYCRVSFVN